MGKAACDIRIGTSGWHYGHWSGPFYPSKLPKNQWFEFYAQHFDTVELNNTFYHQPKLQTFKNWQKQAPKDFLFTVKANRFITHIKRLKDVQEPLQRFFTGALLLKKNLGPILYQLPPSMHKDLERLEDFIQLLPKKHAVIFEFRHNSWFSDDTYKLLNKYGAIFCTHDLIGVPTPRVITGRIIYIRFHGPTGRYQGNYTKAMLKNWANWIKEHINNVHSVYAYFNNDVSGHAINNAKTLKEILGIS
ncbi:MAG: hypothetical protein A2173_06075 [Planctomycetes bacterium RBG_13_44_8b]|nr:MAG: hypothetical protein A2173_06075 [Planctomycetes bacterium RBG_13_44_8b]